MNGTPPVRRRLVGMALRRYRENRGFTLEDAARVLECDRSKISRIETGQRGIRARDLRDLIAEYDIGEQERALLAAIATPKSASGWWQRYEDVLTGESRDYLIMESLAGQILTYHTQQIPDLLQTKAYALAVAEASTSAPDPDAGAPSGRGDARPPRGHPRSQRAGTHRDHRGRRATPAGRRSRRHARPARPAGRTG